MRTWTIYILKDPDSHEVRYVGVTHHPLSRRLKGHLRLVREGKRYHVSNWIRGLSEGGRAPEIEAVEMGAGGGWAEAEKGWIRFYRASGCRLTNLTEGGEGAWGHTVSAEARERIGAAHKIAASRKAKVG